MAITETQRTEIVKATVAMFGAAPGGYMTALTDLYTSVNGNMNAFMNALAETAAFQNTFTNFNTNAEKAVKMALNYGLDSTTDAGTAAIAYFTQNLDAGVSIGSLFAAANTFLSTTTDAAFADAKAELANKTTVASYYTVDMAGTSTDLAVLASTVADVTATTDVTDPAAIIENTAAATTGQTYNLTTGVDAITGTIGADTINATINNDGTDFTGTLSALDTINGGAGTDTLTILDVTSTTNATGQNLSDATISNVEIINIRTVNNVENTTAASLDLSAIAGLATVNITQAIDASITVATTTDINVSGVTGQTTTVGGDDVTVTQDMNATAGSGVQVNTAKNVTITATDSVAAALGINVGAAAATAATGTVTINATGAAVVGNDGAVVLDAITVFGGTSVNITQVAAASYGDAASTNAGGNDIITQGAVVVNTTDSTTGITITQDVARAAANAAATTGGVTETASVKFGALTATATLAAGGLTFTAAEDMTAAEVAAAFANLVNDAAKGTLLAGDTQSAGVYTDGTYTGNFSGWTSAAAAGDTVVFTNTTANSVQANLSFVLAGAGAATSVAPIVTTTEGKAHDATMAGGVTGIVAGAVTIAAGATAAALTEVTVDSYGLFKILCQCFCLSLVNSNRLDQKPRKKLFLRME